MRPRLNPPARTFLGFAATLLTVWLVSCAPAPKPEGPLPASGATVAPPPACIALRKHGGSC